MPVNAARRVLRIERDALSRLIPRVGADFRRACQIIFKCRGRLVLTGMGKPGFIAQKVSATLSSTGTPSLFLHPADAHHGDLGRVMKQDVVVAFSTSGRTEEIVKLLPVIRRIGAKLISFTGDPRSPLAAASDVVIDVSVKKEACSLNLAPTASTTAMLAMGDALAVALLEMKGFRAEDFALYHPGGNLGKQLLLKVSDIMRTGRSNPLVRETAKVKDVLYRITEARAGSATVVDAKGRLKGIFTDGDLRRHLREGERVLERPVAELMTAGPVTIRADRLAAEALEILRTRKIDEVPVVDARRRPVGLLDVQDLLKAGIL
ncbi:MAG TPA: KpsF/GutQ family sugar-phosphate isomerase [Candidatus Eisenbacteria bacterium]|nr:KpsF/GutQ family sugar-phosphate isomerase [Candidatus Eisenbacteria bacterium]